MLSRCDGWAFGIGWMHVIRVELHWTRVCTTWRGYVAGNTARIRDNDLNEKIGISFLFLLLLFVLH